MRLYSQSNLGLAVALVLSILSCSNHLTSARPQSGGSPNDKGFGSAAASVSGSISGGGGSGSVSAGAGADAQKNGGGSGGISTSASIGFSQNGGLSMSGSASGLAEGGAAGGSSSGGSAQASASVSIVSTTTPKPEGLLEKMKDIFKEGKEMVRNSVENLTGQQSSANSNQTSPGSPSGPPFGTSTPKPEGFIDKMADMAKKGKEAFDSRKEALKENLDNKKESIKETFRSEKDAIKDVFDPKRNDERKGEERKGEERKGEERKFEERKPEDRGKDGENREGFIDKVTHFVSKGTESVRDSMHRLEDKAHDFGDKVQKVVDENITKPMQSTSGSGQKTSEGSMASEAETNSKLRGVDREKHLVDVKRRQESELSRPSNLKEVVQDAKSRGVIPQNEDRSVLRGNHDDEKSLTVEVFDKAHEMAKIPVESVLKPLDKMLGYEKDPLLRIYDNSHELLRKPLGMVAKPVESVLTGAFKTTDEAKKDYEKLLATTSEQERKEAKIKEEKAKRDDRSVVGEIADKTLELATKPIEIVLKPFDHVLGFDKDGKKNPFLKTLDSLYGLSKKPVDAVAKPFESILRKMADGEQMYQVSIRFSDGADPKLVTRLADGALNIADRVLTRPLEIVLKPLNHVLGFDEPGKKNPILEAAHSLKNATKVGVELFTKPIDRIIKEIADIGDNKNDSEREAEYERQKQEASRLVKAFDKLHDAAQFPFEIVLRPVSRVLGINKEGKKEPFLRAWDVIHQVVRTPIQVISKPVEDAILGEKPRKQQKQPMNMGNSRPSMGGNGKKGADNYDSANKNIITDSIKKVEKFATKPLDIITSPIRRMILGEDNEKVGSDTEKKNREVQAKYKTSGDNKGTTRGQLKGDKQPDKIITTIERMNNVILKPLEVMTQPISDIISPDKRSKHEKKGSQDSRSGKQN